MTAKWIRFLCWVLAVVFLYGCKPSEKQYEAEGQAMKGILNLINMYTYRFPGVPVTNLAQLFAAEGQGYPHTWHRRFIAFGKHAGFTNSFYEKYIFFPAGITNRWIEGEVTFMNARPYPGPDGQLQRTVISRISTGYFRQVLGEKAVQQLFRDNGIVEPKPVTMPPPPPAPPTARGDPITFKVSNRIIMFAQSLGMTGSGALVVRNVIFYSPLVLTPLLGFWLWRRSRR